MLYMVTDTSPIPRPLMPHWPRRWPSKGHTDIDIVGHIEGLLVSPHFSQPNSIEFDSATKWRHQREIEKAVRKDVRDSHTCQLFTVMKHSIHMMQVSPRHLAPCTAAPLSDEVMEE